MLKSGKHTLKELLANVQIEQILIPEIQRDYVWTKENVKGLISSIEEDAEAESKNTIDDSLLKGMSLAQRELIQRTLEENKRFSNIGFIYAYYDPEINDRYYLIDGQQRITTLYLFLLALAVKTGNNANFLQSYFKNKLPKVDYKVREAAHEFILQFIPFIVDNGNVEKVKNQPWYYKEYDYDKTIQSHINNYKELSSLVETTIIDFDFAENNIEFWYFDTDKSEQGEELYIYMNSRGESVKSNENIKAQLLEGLTEDEKITEGLKWEDWQRFFWINRSTFGNSNADPGFDEFLRWNKIIRFIADNPTKSQKDHSEYVREIKQAEKIDTEYLTFKGIENTFLVIKELSGDANFVYFKKEWLEGSTKIADYIRLLPIVLYINESSKKNLTTDDINRFFRFFTNILKSEEIRKNPDGYLSQSILLVNDFNKEGHSDVADIGLTKSASNFPNILTDEELFKFQLYKSNSHKYSRADIERIFWEQEDFKLSDGSIQLILECMGITTKSNVANFDLEKFDKYASLFREIFNSPDDVLRRALLTVGDYSFNEGYSTALEMSRYNFGSTVEDWRYICQNSNSRTIVVLFLQGLLAISEHENSKDYTKLMTGIISKYVNSATNVSMIFPIISNPKVFEFARNKKICISSAEIYVLQGKNASNYAKLEDIK